VLSEDHAKLCAIIGDRYYQQDPEWWKAIADAILRAHAAQVRKDNPVTDRCPECGTFQINGLDRFCPDCGLPLTEEP